MTTTASDPEPLEEKDWEIISHSDLDDGCRSHPHNGGVSASASIKLGKGEKKKEVFSFHFHTGGRCDGCRRYDLNEEKSAQRRDGWEDETVVGDDDAEDIHGSEKRGGTVLEGKGLPAT